MKKVLIGMAAIGGSIGAITGMYTFRHKTQQNKYTITVPLILILQIAAVMLLSSCGSGSAAYTKISQDEAVQMMQEESGYLIVDVRRPDEFAEGHIAGAINVPNETIEDEMPADLPDKDQMLLVYCRSGNRSKEAAQKLADIGYTNVYEFGGINTWQGEIVTGEEESGAADSTDYGIDYLVLVNSSTRLPDDWEDKLQLAETTNSVGDKVQTEKNAYASYLKLKAALEEEGVHTELDSAYRSVAEQQKIVDDFTEKYGAEYVASYVSVPGYSEHHTGLALDLYLIVDGVTVYENEDLVQYPEVWAKIHEKLPDYGFILRYFEGNNAGYAYEPWHIRYVGSSEIAREITERGITLEDYLADR